MKFCGTSGGVLRELEKHNGVVSINSPSASVTSDTEFQFLHYRKSAEVIQCYQISKAFCLNREDY